LALGAILGVVIAATWASRLIEPRSIYDARLTDEEIAQRQRFREPPNR
jgi:CIC family chloride channel protein